MSISQFFVLSPRGDTIIYRDYCHDCPKNTPEIFFRSHKFWDGKHQRAPPVFHLDGVNYMYILLNGLCFVVTTKKNVSPAFYIELLSRLTKVFKDYCGTLNEESMRSNFVLIYELLDEIIDHGYVQDTSSDQLKSYVFNQPIVSHRNQGSSFKVPDMHQKTTPSTSVDKPIIHPSRRSKQRNEIFVDIYERINLTINSNGYVLNSSINGSIQMKSYLAGNPALRLALNEDLVIGKSGSGAGYGVLEIDDCNFHECVKLDDFDNTRTLFFTPPDGEFVVMNYRITSDFRVPFRIFPFFELINPYKVELIVKVRADIPEQNYGGNVLIEFPVPKSTSGVACDLGVGVRGQSSEFLSSMRKVQWKIKKFMGGKEHTLRARISLSSAHSSNVRKEIGPITMQFEVPMYNPSNLHVRYLRIAENARAYNPYRWVRYVTRSSSYVCRL